MAEEPIEIEDIGSNPAPSRPIGTLIAERLSRREALLAGAGLAAAAAALPPPWRRIPATRRMAAPPPSASRSSATSSPSATRWPRGTRSRW